MAVVVHGQPSCACANPSWPFPSTRPSFDDSTSERALIGLPPPFPSPSTDGLGLRSVLATNLHNSTSSPSKHVEYPAMADLGGSTGSTEHATNPANMQRRGGSVRGGGRHTPSDHGLQHPTARGRGRGGSQHQKRGGGSRGRGGHTGDKGKAPVTEPNGTGSTPSIPLAKPKLPSSDNEDVDGEVCFICASPVQHTAVAPCNHRTCHICSIRMRALYKTKSCAHCRTESSHIILTDDTDKNYDCFSPDDFFKSDDNLGIHFENPVVFDDTRLLLQYNCPDGSCDVACLGWPDLHRHVKTAHNKVMWYALSDDISVLVC